MGLQDLKRALKRRRGSGGTRVMGQEETEGKGVKRRRTTMSKSTEFDDVSTQSSTFDSSSCESPVTVLGGDSAAPPPPPVTISCASRLSPTRAARVAMLKARFAGTIIKAKQNVLYAPGTGSSSGRNTTTEDRIQKFRAAEMRKANELVKKQRQRDREAARRALDEMEKNVVIIDNFQVMRDLERRVVQSFRDVSLTRSVLHYLRGDSC